MDSIYNSASLQIPVKIGLINAIFSTDSAPKVTGNQCITPLHNHHDYELRYVARGRCTQTISAKNYIAYPGDIIIVRPLEYHFQQASDVDAEQYTVRFLISCASQSSSTQKAYKLAIKILQTHRILHDDSGEILSSFKMLSNELSEQNDGFISNIKSICSILLTDLLRRSACNISDIYSPDGLKYYDFDRHALDKYLYTHAFDSSANIGTLAEMMNISKRQVNNIINKKYGLTFTAKINEIRMEYAAVLLLSTDRSIEQILGECGFKNYNYFSKCFKKRFGTTPSKYRSSTNL